MNIQTAFFESSYFLFGKYYVYADRSSVMV